jgi:hypothetical protein
MSLAMHNKIDVFHTMQIKQSTFERLKNHSKYFCKDVTSYDDIIKRLLNFYEEFDRNRRF